MRQVDIKLESVDYSATQSFYHRSVVFLIWLELKCCLFIYHEHNPSEALVLIMKHLPQINNYKFSLANLPAIHSSKARYLTIKDECQWTRWKEIIYYRYAMVSYELKYGYSLLLARLIDRQPQNIQSIFSHYLELDSPKSVRQSAGRCLYMLDKYASTYVHNAQDNPLSGFLFDYSTLSFEPSSEIAAILPLFEMLAIQQHPFPNGDSEKLDYPHYALVQKVFDLYVCACLNTPKSIFKLVDVSD